MVKFSRNWVLKARIFLRVFVHAKRKVRHNQNLFQLPLFSGTNRVVLFSRMAIKTIELLKGCGSQEEIMEVLAAVASDMGDAIDDVSTLQVIPLKGAMTNEVFQVKWPSKNGGEVRKVLVRLYGEGVEVFFDREEEVKTFECMSKHGQGPRLLGRFTSGRVEEFIHARVCSYPLSFLIFLFLKKFTRLLHGLRKLSLLTRSNSCS